MRYANFTREDEIAFVDFTRSGAVAALIYSNNLIARGHVEQYDYDNASVRTVAISGVIYVPVTLFTRYFDASFDGRALVRGDMTYVPASTCHAGGVTGVPAVEAAKALGLCAKVYYEGRFLIVCREGRDADFAYLDAHPEQVAGGTYAILGKYDAAEFSPEDFRAAKDNWRRKLVGTPEGNDLSNPAVASKIGYLERRCTAVRETLHREADAAILFGDTPAVESADLTAQYRDLAFLARAWATPGSKYFHVDSLLDDILYGLEWLYTHLYGQAEIDGTGWRDVKIFNWWDWYVGAAEHLTDIILMIEEHLTKEQIKNYLACFEYVATFMRHRENTGEAMSRICICTKVGLALEEPKYLNREYGDFDRLLDLAEEGFGPHVDYVDFTHGMPYNMAYGLLNLDRELLVASILSGTRLAYNSPQMYNQFMMAKYMFEPAMYRGQGFMMFCGRSTFKAEFDPGVSVMVNLLPMIGVFGEDEDRYLKCMIKRHCADPAVADMVRGRCSLYDLAVFEDLMRDETVPAWRDYEYAHAWFTGDRAVQQRNDFAIGIAMSSEREPSYESINSANKTGWYTGDGATYYYTTYDSHPYDGKNFIDNTSIAYRFPGTTEDSRPRTVRSISSGYAWRMPTDFAGSLQFADKYIAAAMDFVSFDFKGPDQNIPDTGYGSCLAVHENDLHAKKAWFCFDDEVVVLGAGITSTMSSPVHTTLEHRRIVKDEQFAQSVCADSTVTTLAKKPFAAQFENAKWMCWDGHLGFVFPDGGTLYTARYNCEACEGQPYLEVRLEHGENPTDATYAYIVLPYADEDRLSAYAASPDVTVLSNTAALQAVSDKSSGVTGYTFHEAGSCRDVAVDTPCIVMDGTDGDIRTLVMTDPTHKAEQVTITVAGKYRLISAKKYGEDSDCIRVECGACETVTRCDTTLANGRPFEVKLEIL